MALLAHSAAFSVDWRCTGGAGNAYLSQDVDENIESQRDAICQFDMKMKMRNMNEKHSFFF